MILRCLHVFYGRLRWKFDHLYVYSCVPLVSRGKTGKTQVDTPASWHTVCLIFSKDCNFQQVTWKNIVWLKNLSCLISDNFSWWIINQTEWVSFAKMKSVSKNNIKWKAAIKAFLSSLSYKMQNKMMFNLPCENK